MSLQFSRVSFVETQKVCSTAAPICEEGCLLVKDASDGCLECSCDGGKCKTMQMNINFEIVYIARFYY